MHVSLTTKTFLKKEFTEIQGICLIVLQACYVGHHIYLQTGDTF